MSALQISGLAKESVMLPHVHWDADWDVAGWLSGKRGIKTPRTTQINYNDFDQRRVRFSSP